MITRKPTRFVIFPQGRPCRTFRSKVVFARPPGAERETVRERDCLPPGETLRELHYTLLNDWRIPPNIVPEVTDPLECPTRRRKWPAVPVWTVAAISFALGFLLGAILL